jgi:predicted aspartyl protease
MISGVVTGDRQAVIHLTVRGPAGQEQEIEAIIDTGFDGSLSLLPQLWSSLACPGANMAVHFWQMAARAFLTSTKLQWIGTGEARRIAVDEAETVPLIGMSLLEGYELTVQVQRGGNVTVRALSQAKGG